jgi:hypothetical protein
MAGLGGGSNFGSNPETGKWGLQGGGGVLGKFGFSSGGDALNIDGGVRTPGGYFGPFLTVGAW